MKHVVLYNPYSGNNMGKDQAKAIEAEFPAGEEFIYEDITAIEDNIPSFLAERTEEEQVIVAGGDGTIHKLANRLAGKEIPCEIWFYPVGSGNDFFTDIKDEFDGKKVVPVSKFLKDLPTVEVNGQTYSVVNGIGFGIDGYCCEEGDKLRALSDKDINYASIAIKGLLFHFKPSNAVITVDGVEHTYKKVWLAPTMNGRYYGGGMKVAPLQDRMNEEKKLSLVVMYGSGKLKSLIVFPSLFKGTHVEHTEMVEVLTGKEITVTFDAPQALQIDGETIPGVLSYTARAAK